MLRDHLHLPYRAPDSLGLVARVEAKRATHPMINACYRVLSVANCRPRVGIYLVRTASEIGTEYGNVVRPFNACLVVRSTHMHVYVLIMES